MPTFNKIPFFSSDENVTSGDLNLISAFLMNYNKNFVNSVISGNDCILNGLGLTANTTNITLASGFAFYNSPTSNNTITVLNSSPPTTLPMNGSILEIDGPLTLTPSNPHATLDRIDGIDLIANQTPTTSASRNFINPGTGIVTSQSTPTQLIENYVQNPGSSGSNIVITAGTPGATPFIPAVPAGYIRLATVYITHGVSLNIVQGNILYTMPYIWELQTFPGTPNTANQCMTLSDILSAIKSQLTSITGQSNWYNLPIYNLSNLNGVGLSPASLSSDQNNYNPTGWTNLGITSLRLSATASITLTGLVALTPNQKIIIFNTSNFPITLSNQNGSSSSGNQFLLPNGLNVTINPLESQQIIYDGVLSKWVLVGKGINSMPSYDSARWWAIGIQAGSTSITPNVYAVGNAQPNTGGVFFDGTDSNGPGVGFQSVSSNTLCGIYTGITQPFMAFMSFFTKIRTNLNNNNGTSWAFFGLTSSALSATTAPTNILASFSGFGFLLIYPNASPSAPDLYFVNNNGGLTTLQYHIGTIINTNALFLKAIFSGSQFNICVPEFAIPTVTSQIPTIGTLMAWEAIYSSYSDSLNAAKTVFYDSYLQYSS